LAVALSQTADFRWRLPAAHAWEVGRWERLGIVLLAQPACGRYRPDFALVAPGARPSEPPPLVVEVDGRAHHDSAADQLERDRARDRSMVARGTRVLRFAGSEVWRDAQGCAEEVLACAARLFANTPM
jgi:very-short-patch-repair endonuclease